MKKLLGLGLVLSAGFALTGCLQQEEALNIIWYPTEGTPERSDFRDEMKNILEEATGKEFQHQIVTDYEAAIEAISSGGNNAVVPVSSPNGYILANEINDAVKPIATGALDGDIDQMGYFSWLVTMTDDHKGDNTISESSFIDVEESATFTEKYNLENLKDTRFSFVSGTSTSGFKYPASTIAQLFGEGDADKEADIKEDLSKQDDAGIFSNVEFGFGNSHQGSLYNLLEGTSDVAAVCDGCIGDYITLTGDVAHNTPGATYKVTGEYAASETEGGTEVELFKEHKDREFVILSSTQVPGTPFVVNEDVLTEGEIQAIKDMLVSDEVSNNELIFNQSEDSSTGFYGYKEKFTLDLTDAHYDPIRNL